MKKTIEKKLLSYFEPSVISTSAAKYITNVSHMPDDSDIKQYLNSILLHNYKCICKDFIINKIPPEIMHIIKGYLLDKPLVSIKQAKLYWLNIYIKKLDTMKEEDEFDLMYYNPGQIDYDWSYRRLNMIKCDMEYINSKKIIAQENCS